ncbi:hypothetical protein Bca52824_058798 [Brassica carinata]|uniref:Uncharacterized protein n=1 Tax=Brassica carinata TaxID=52824 RepID=A0A8X7QYG7_BRACI|nr:hypothetical protein Bca52824_058798 [Brassica carinata]
MNARTRAEGKTDNIEKQISEICSKTLKNVIGLLYPDLSLSPTIPPRPTGTGEEGSGGQTETMLNPLWPGLELVIAGTSAEVPLPPEMIVE